jgi:predicted phage terminase large subunit-like protein
MQRSSNPSSASAAKYEDRPRPWRGTFRDYIPHVDPEYQFARHMEKLIAALQRVADGECTRLIVSMPPRHGKSRTISELFPAYYVGRFPWHKVIISSYEEGLAVDFAASARDQIISPDYPYSDVKPKGKAKGDIELDGWPGMIYAAGVMGGIVGRGAHLLIVDDPLKGQEWADSAKMRQKVYDWLKGDAMRRLENQLADLGESADGKRKAAVVIVHTRWHDGDPAGRLLAEMRNNPEAEEWEYLNLPALAEDDDPLGREKGDALWPERFSQRDLLTIRANTPPRIWGAQYQGKPLTDEARLFPQDWFNLRYDLRVLPAFEQIVQVVDSGWKTGVDNSYSVCATWGRSKLHYYLLDIWRDRVTYPTLIHRLRDQYFKWHPFGCDGQYIEDAASGTGAIFSLRVEPDDRGMVNAIPFDIDGVGQYYFVESASPFFMAQRVLLPQFAPWLADWIAEHVNYPTAENDDQPVTTAMALRILSGGRTTRTDDDEDLRAFGKPGARSPEGGDGFGKRRRIAA